MNAVSQFLEGLGRCAGLHRASRRSAHSGKFIAGNMQSIQSIISSAGILPMSLEFFNFRHFIPFRRAGLVGKTCNQIPQPLVNIDIDIYFSVCMGFLPGFEFIQKPTARMMVLLLISRQLRHKHTQIYHAPLNAA